ncbi:MAG: hypothetical protein FJ288_02545 [Planctomycetes bacterium]|nr:hypothetical protein [Planctomycetota bacterium]
MSDNLNVLGRPDFRARLAEVLAGARPRSAEALWQFVRAAYGLAVPRRAVCLGHAAPMDYLASAILRPGRDLVVWANRGGAKTELGAVAAHLDAVLRPGCQVRILGGSLDQSEKMYEYLVRKWRGPFAALLAREPTARRTELATGSAIEVLTQSPRSVRGQRVHRLKCDELDEFDPDVWQAAQFITQSGPGADGQWIAAQMEVFSTMHRPFGPMAALVERLSDCGFRNADCGLKDMPSEGAQGRGGGGAQGRPPPDAQSALRTPQLPLLLRWCLWEVIEPCPPERSCSRCPLWSGCGGKARGADGYFPIDDALAQHARASRAAWETEMLCLRPRGQGLVFDEFDPARHVAPVGFDPALPLYRAIDFGYANPFVCLWVQMKGDCAAQGAERGADERRAPPAPAAGAPQAALRGPQFSGPDLSRVQVRVLAEYVERERLICEHARAMRRLDPGPVAATYADPAGWHRSDVTGTGPCQELAAAGMRVRTPRAGILEGVELVRRLLKERPAAAGPGLVIDPSCRWLIRAFQEYHWEESADGRRGERPAKDGADHPLDALRYLLVGLFWRRLPLRERPWW